MQETTLYCIGVYLLSEIKFESVLLTEVNNFWIVFLCKKKTNSHFQITTSRFYYTIHSTPLHHSVSQSTTTDSIEITLNTLTLQITTSSVTFKSHTLHTTLSLSTFSNTSTGYSTYFNQNKLNPPLPLSHTQISLLYI